MTPGVVSGGEFGRRHAPRRRGPEQHHDGRRLGHGHRQQRPDAEHEHRVDRRSESADVGLPGRVRPLVRPADHGRHQERIEPFHGSVYTFRTPTPTWNSNSLGQREERRSEGTNVQTTSTATRSAARWASRAATTSSSSSTLMSTGRRTAPSTTATRSGSALPTALERAGRFLADARQQRRPVQYDHGHARPGSLLGHRYAGCFQDGGVLGKIPANRLYGPGLALLSRYPLPNITQAPGTNYNYQSRPPSVDEPDCSSRRFALDYQFSPKLRFTGSTRVSSRRSVTAPGHAPGLQRRADAVSRPSPTTRVTVNYSMKPTMFIEGDLWVHPEPARRRQSKAACSSTTLPNRLTGDAGLPAALP